MRLLRYTTPFQSGPVCLWLQFPCSAGGVQLAAARDHDESLLRLPRGLARKENKN